MASENVDDYFHKEDSRLSPVSSECEGTSEEQRGTPSSGLTSDCYPARDTAFPRLSTSANSSRTIQPSTPGIGKVFSIDNILGKSDNTNNHRDKIKAYQHNEKMTQEHPITSRETHRTANSPSLLPVHPTAARPLTPGFTTDAARGQYTLISSVSAAAAGTPVSHISAVTPSVPYTHPLSIGIGDLAPTHSSWLYPGYVTRQQFFGLNGESNFKLSHQFASQR